MTPAGQGQDPDIEILIRVESHNLIANDWGNTSLIMLVVNVVLSAVVSSSLFQVFALPSYVDAILSLLVAINSGLIAALDPSGRFAKHRDAIAKYRQAEGISDSIKLKIRLGEIEAESPILRFKTRIRAINRLKKLGKLS
jgi:hypothetical protein